MGLFSKGKKTTIKIKTDGTGGAIKKFRALIGAGVILAILNAVGAANYIPEGMLNEVADVILKVIDLVFAWYVHRELAPVLQAAANAQTPEDVAVVKAAAGVVEE